MQPRPHSTAPCTIASFDGVWKNCHPLAASRTPENLCTSKQGPLGHPMASSFSEGFFLPGGMVSSLGPQGHFLMAKVSGDLPG